jgi:Ser/Thr protein kinase RdoA (MazF antagonist)
LKAFEDLSPRGQIQRLRRIATNALKHYPLTIKSLKKLNHAENTTFRLVTDDPVAISDGRFYSQFLVRVHRTGYQNEKAIRSELKWLSALSEGGFNNQQVLFTRDQNALSKASTKGVEQEHIVSVLSWIDGRIYSEMPSLNALSSIGELTGKLHNMSANWSLPPGFERRTLNVSGTFRDTDGQLDNPEIWGRLTKSQREIFLRVRNDYDQSFDQLRKNTDSFGLIHFDLHFGNLVFQGASAPVPIDFDDSGFAPFVADLGVTLGHWMASDTLGVKVSALLEGYRRVRSLTEIEEEALPLFIASRGVSAVLWGIDRSRIHKGFNKFLPRWIKSVESCAIKHYSPSGLLSGVVV